MTCTSSSGSTSNQFENGYVGTTIWFKGCLVICQQPHTKVVDMMKDKFNMVGKPIEDFDLPGTKNNRQSIASLAGKKNVVIVLLRGRYWPYCQAHLKNLNKDVKKFEEQDAMIYPILADSESGAKKLESICEECQIPIFFDQSKTVVKNLHQEVILSKWGRMPAMIILDKKGIVRYAYFGESMSDIPRNDEVLSILQEINVK